MTHQVGCDRITQGLLEQYPELDAYGIAQEEGLWLRPQLGGETALRGRVIAFDVTRPEDERLATVLRCVTEFKTQRAQRLERLAVCGDDLELPVEALRSA
jgi:hypothetical protein